MDNLSKGKRLSRLFSNQPVQAASIRAALNRGVKHDGHMQKGAAMGALQAYQIGAGEAIRTPDPNLGKVMLYP